MTQHATPQNLERRISVTGYAQLEAVPDEARLSLSVVTEAKKSSEAHRENARQTTRVLEALQEYVKREQTESNYGLHEHNEWDGEKRKNIHRGYRAVHTLEVKTRDLEAVGKIIDAAQEAGADFIVIDTTGHVEGPTAVVLKQHKIELVKPNHLICIRRSRELDPIVAGFEGFTGVQIHHLSPHKSVTSKSSEFRRKYRQSCFDRYFSGNPQETLPFHQIRGQRTPFFIGRGANAKEVEILSDLADDHVLYAEWGHRALAIVTTDATSTLVQARLKAHFSLNHLVAETPEYFERRLIGLLNASGKTLSIGIIEAVNFAASQLKIRCKAGAASETKVIQFGRYKKDDTV